MVNNKMGEISLYLQYSHPRHIYESYHRDLGLGSFDLDQ